MNSISRRATFLLFLAILSLLSGLTYAAPNWSGTIPLNEIPLPPLNQRFPIKNDVKSIQEAYASPIKWDGHSIAIEGRIKSVITTSKGQPSIELSLTSDSSITIWAMFPQPVVRNTFLRVGESLRVLGWLRNASDWAKIVSVELPTQNPLTLLSICLVQLPSLDGAFDSKYLEYCEAWQKGYMPPDLAL